jgi:hypothetical protein
LKHLLSIFDPNHKPTPEEAWEIIVRILARDGGDDGSPLPLSLPEVHPVIEAREEATALAGAA